MSTTLVILLSVIVAVLTCGVIYYAARSVKEGKKATIEKPVGLTMIVLNLGGGIAALALSHAFPIAVKVISIIFLIALIILQLYNKQGKYRALAWDCCAGIFGIALAMSIAGQFDKKGPKFTELWWLLLVLAVPVLGFIADKLRDREVKFNIPKLNKGEVFALALFVILALALVAGIIAIVKLS